MVRLTGAVETLLASLLVVVAGGTDTAVRAGAKLVRVVAGRDAGGAIEARALLAAVVVAVLEDEEEIVRVRGAVVALVAVRVGAVDVLTVETRDGTVGLVVVAARTREAAVGAVTEGRVVVVAGLVAVVVTAGLVVVAERGGGARDWRVARGRTEVVALGTLAGVGLTEPAATLLNGRLHGSTNLPPKTPLRITFLTSPVLEVPLAPLTKGRLTGTSFFGETAGGSTLFSCVATGVGLSSTPLAASGAWTSPIASASAADSRTATASSFAECESSFSTARSAGSPPCCPTSGGLSLPSTERSFDGSASSCLTSAISCSS
jgi:hypothetical protein